MSGLIDFSFGMRWAADSFMRVVDPSISPTYLRVRNFSDPQNQQWAQLGFKITPAAGPTGTQDILIAPPPSVKMISQDNIAKSNGKLRFGAREFLVSHTFVLSAMQALNLIDQTLVWRGPNIVGLVTQNLLCSIEQYVFDALAGEAVMWILTANVSEIR